MAFKKKTAKSQYCSDVRINEIARKAFRAQVVSKYYEEEFKTAKGEFYEYVNTSPDAPEITPGAGNGLKIEDHGSISFSAPSLLQNKDTVQLLLAKVKAGEISVDDLAACVSTVNKENVEKVLSPEDVASVTKPDCHEDGSPIVVITFRPSSAYKQDLQNRLSNPAATLDVNEKLVEELEAEGYEFTSDGLIDSRGRKVA